MKNSLAALFAGFKHSRIRRILLLVFCIAGGLVVGIVGQQVTANPIWFLAVPVCIAFAWFFVADPEQCLVPQSSIRKNSADTNIPIHTTSDK